MKKIDFRTDILPLKNELYRTALRITLNPEEAEDVVQETMLRVWKRREQWDEIESIEAFCLTICRRLALDKTKSMQRQTEDLDDHDEPPDASYTADPQQLAEKRDQVALVKRLIDSLPEKQRSCIQLRDIEGKSYKEIAEVMDITEQQVKINIFRARQTVKQNFEKAEKYGL